MLIDEPEVLSCEWRKKFNKMKVYFYQKNKKTLRKFDFSQFNFRLFIFGATIFLLLTYLISINSTATKGIEISQMQKEIEKLSEQNRSLEIQANELKSLQRIEDLSNKDLNMVISKNFKYLPPHASGEMAIKK